MTRWRVVSDGTPNGTHVYYDGREVKDIQGIRVSIDRGDPMAHIDITVGPAVFELNADRLNSHIIHEQF